MHRSPKAPALLAVLAIFAVLGTATYGALIGVADANSSPRTTISSGTVSFDASTGNLFVTATAVSTDFGGADGVFEHASTPPSQLSISMKVLGAIGLPYQGIGDALSLTGAIDFNRNGTIDAGESGLLLKGDLLEFGFENAPPGTGSDRIEWRFKVTGGLLAPYYQGQNVGVSTLHANDGTWPEPAVAKEDFATSFTLDIIQGQPAPIVTPIKCGAEISDFVWHDVNGNGIQDPGEPGLNGVTVNLKDAAGQLFATTVTGPGPLNQQGYYRFANLTGFCGGTWKVQVDLSTVPNGFVLTTVNAPGSTAGTDSNPNPATVSLPTDMRKERTIDFGFRAAATGVIGDFVWHDLDRDGTQDDGEPGVDGVRVNLRNPLTDAVLATTVTAVNGSYQFTGVGAGNYRVQIDESTLPAGFAPTFSNSGAADGDSNGSPADVTLASGTATDHTIDFGYLTPCTGSIGDFLWYDRNRNGIQDAGEAGIDGVTINLVDQFGTVLATTSTGANGSYAFTGLCANIYKVEVVSSTLPEGFTATAVNVPGSDPDKDSNPNPSKVTLETDGSAEPAIDFGFLAPCMGRIGNFVWHDENQNGIQDSGEGGFADVTVNLRHAGDNAVLQTEITEADGAYLFSGLCPGDYLVEVVPSTGTSASPTQQGSDRNKDSNPNSFPATLPWDDSADLSIDFGLYCTGIIGDRVWVDANANGVQDAGEPGIAGVTVMLTNILLGEVRTTTTDANGLYRFTGLCAGKYQVEVSGVPAHHTPTVRLAGGDVTRDSNGSPALLILSANDSVDLTIDFGFVKPSAPEPTPGIKILKSANKDKVVFGEAVTFTYVVTNTGNVALNAVVVVDDNSTPRYAADDFTVGSVDTLAAGQSITFTATRIPPTKMCNFDWLGKLRKCGLMIIDDWLQHKKFTYLQAKDHRDDYSDWNGWAGHRSYSRKGKFRILDKLNISSQEANTDAVDVVDDEEYVTAFITTVDKNYVTSGDHSVTFPKIFHKKGWDRDWHHDWDSWFGNWLRSRRWDDDWRDHDNDGDYDYDKHPRPCTTTSTNVATVTAKYAGTIFTATDKATVEIVAPAPAAPYKTFTQGGWGARPSGNNPGRFLSDNFNRVYPGGQVVIGGVKTIKLTSAYAIHEFLPQGGTPAKLTYSYVNPTRQISVFAGQVLALKLNVDFSAAGISRRGFGNLTVVSGELGGKTVNEVLALANSVLGGGSLPWGLTVSELNSIVSKINENFDGGTQNNGFLAE
jgi:hypothetical protein